jgi:hypothetical protein
MFINNPKLSFLVLSFIFLSVFVFNTACVSNNLNLATAEVDNIRKLVKNNQFDRIFSESYSEFQNNVSKIQFIKDLESVKGDIENPQNFSLNNWRFYKTTSQSFVTLTYKSNGKTKFIGAEEYVFIWENGKYRLYNYSVINKK